jgi:serine/threonine protein kinase
MMQKNNFDCEMEDYRKRLHAGPVTKSKEGLLSPDEMDAVKAKYPDIYESFLFLEEIGKGSYKRTILIKHKETTETLALKIVDMKKIIKDERAMDNLRNSNYGVDPIQAFIHEGERMDLLKKAGIKHISFPHMHGQQDHFYFFIEHYSERTLLNYININHKKYPFNKKIVNYLALGLAKVISGIHSAGYYHSDLHPANILFNNAELNITDFDLCSSIFGIDDEQKYLVPHSEVRSPQLLLGQRVEPAGVDVWSYGIDVLFMIWGEMPFQTGFNSDFEGWKTLTNEQRQQYRNNILNQIMDDKVYESVLKRTYETLDEKLAQVIEKSLQRDTKLRFKNGIELYQTLTS